MPIEFDTVSELTYPTNIEMGLDTEKITEAYQELYLAVGLAHGKRVGASINKQLKRFEIDFFDAEFRRGLRKWLVDNAGSRIVSVRRELIKYLIDYMGARLEEGLTADQVVSRIQKHILTRNFYRWQIERIVRTETTAAANYGASRAGDVSGVLMVKEWVSSSDARTRQHEKGDRYDHFDMEGVQVNKDEPFSVPDINGLADQIMYPGDPKGRPGNVINCRCTVGLIPKRDLNGDLIFT